MQEAFAWNPGGREDSAFVLVSVWLRSRVSPVPPRPTELGDCRRHARGRIATSRSSSASKRHKRSGTRGTKPTDSDTAGWGHPWPSFQNTKSARGVNCPKVACAIETFRVICLSVALARNGFGGTRTLLSTSAPKSQWSSPLS